MIVCSPSSSNVEAPISKVQLLRKARVRFCFNDILRNCCCTISFQGLWSLLSLSKDGLADSLWATSSILHNLQAIRRGRSIPLTLPSLDQTLHAREEAVVKSCSAVISKILEEQRSEVGEADLEGPRIRVLNTVISQRISFGHEEFDIRY